MMMSNYCVDVWKTAERNPIRGLRVCGSDLYVYIYIYIYIFKCNKLFMDLNIDNPWRTIKFNGIHFYFFHFPFLYCFKQI